MPALSLEEVSFRYTAQQSFRFTFALSEQSGLAIIGPSGAGKSTLLALIAGFLRPCGGRIYMQGTEVQTLHPARRPVSCMFQEHNLFAHLSLFSNVAIGLSPSLHVSRQARARVEEALARVGLSDFRHRKPGELSGGQRQRAALARCIARRKPLFLLDEPFAALDLGLRQEMRVLLNEIAREHRLNIVLVSHHPRDALILCKQTIFLQQGRIVEMGSTKKILQQSPSSEVRKFLGLSA